MKAVIFSREPAAGGKRKSARVPHGVERRAFGEIKRSLLDLRAETLIYLDVSGLTDGERSRLVAATVRRAGRRVGILDPEGRVRDVAALFHAGVVDYVGKTGLTPRRLAAVRRFTFRHGAGQDGVKLAGPKPGGAKPGGAKPGGAKPGGPKLGGAKLGGAKLAGAKPGDAKPGDAKPGGPKQDRTRRVGSARVGGKSRAAPADNLPSGGADGWEGIEDGREHRFAFLYIEVDDAEEMKKRYEQANLTSAMETFRVFVERMVVAHGGRLWMWSRFGGLVLFPFREPDFPAPLCGLRIILARIFYDAEESPLPGRLSFRMALTVGSTVYNSNDSGRIVSDGVNSIFHLGRRFANPGQFLLTAEAAGLTPEWLRPSLVASGSFEGRRILRMLQPVPSTGDRG